MLEWNIHSSGLIGTIDCRNRMVLKWNTTPKDLSTIELEHCVEMGFDSIV